ncbi:hypothetical protein OG422_05115 [Streptomyces sp. NBC_01525]|uniref:hypothetical protein n=1 Tax=Streptomyces sp. NBC_01525 TaxID=2903893 RepID=UPI00386F7345
MAALAVVAAVGLMADDRVLVGAPIWLKPFKFAVSFTAYGLTLAWMLGHRGPTRTGRWAAHAVVAAGIVEMAIIVGQTIRGRSSHFNVETPLDRALFQIMGVTIAVLWTGTLVIAVLLFRTRLGDRAATWAIRLGMLLGLTGLLLGALMLIPTPDQQAAGALRTAIGAHSVGVPDGGPAAPVTGWNTTGGDLRIPHFFGMHALQALPLLLYGIDALGARFPRLRAERVRLRLVLVAAGAAAALLALLTWQALRGQALTHPDAATLTALTCLTLLTALATAAAIRRPDRALPRTRAPRPAPDAPRRSPA